MIIEEHYLRHSVRESLSIIPALSASARRVMGKI